MPRFNNEIGCNLIKLDKNNEEREAFAKYKPKITDFCDSNPELDLKVGDVISFMAGYNDDIKYISEILGFSSDGRAFMLWDCYWSNINLVERNWKKVTPEELKQSYNSTHFND